MKIKLVCLNVVILFFCGNVFSQNDNNSFILGCGFNIVDDSFSSTYNPFNSSEQWNIGKFPSYYSLSSELFERTFVGFAVTTNDYKKNKLINGVNIVEEKKYYALDVFLQYKFVSEYSDFIDINLFDPFINVGASETRIDKSVFYTINYGLGFYIWLNGLNQSNYFINRRGENGGFGLIFNLNAKSSNQQKLFGNHLQSSCGIVFSF